MSDERIPDGLLCEQKVSQPPWGLCKPPHITFIFSLRHQHIWHDDVYLDFTLIYPPDGKLIISGNVLRLFLWYFFWFCFFFFRMSFRLYFPNTVHNMFISVYYRTVFLASVYQYTALVCFVVFVLNSIRGGVLLYEREKGVGVGVWAHVCVCSPRQERNVSHCSIYLQWLSLCNSECIFVHWIYNYICMKQEKRLGFIVLTTAVAV